MVTRAAGSFRSGLVRVDFIAESQHCLSCSRGQKVHKSRTRIVATLAEGWFEAREVLKHCGSQGCAAVSSRKLSLIVAPGQRYGWDLVVHVGMARYLRGMQRDEIRAELRESYGIEVSQGTVSNLCDRFLVAFGTLHERRAPALRAAMEEGFWLHIDATSDRGKGGLFVCLDGWRGWTLLAARIPSENGETLRPLVDKTVAMFGDPIATVRDLGEAGAKAVEPLRERAIPDLLCHFHFLAAVGKKLFDKSYTHLRNRLRALGAKGDLCGVLAELRRYRRTNDRRGRFGRGEVREELLAAVLWVMEGNGTQSSRYPFALPLLDTVRRCWQAVEQAQQWVPSPRSDVENAVIRHLGRLASSLRRDHSVTKAVQQLEESWAPFCELRDVLRLTNADASLQDSCSAKDAALPELELLHRQQIEIALSRYGVDLRNRVSTVGKKNSQFCPQAVIVDYIDRYGSQLVGHPAIRDDNGRVLAVVHRTNNIAERFFATTKQSLRRRVGRVHLGRDMELQPPQAALVRNLLLPDYVRVLCGSLENLPLALANVHLETSPAPILVRENRDTDTIRCLRALLQHSTPKPVDVPVIPPSPMPQLDVSTVS